MSNLLIFFTAISFLLKVYFFKFFFLKKIFSYTFNFYARKKKEAMMILFIKNDRMLKVTRKICVIYWPNSGKPYILLNRWHLCRIVCRVNLPFIFVRCCIWRQLSWGTIETPRSAYIDDEAGNGFLDNVY